ncbi:hypothetical protein [Scytonema sp. NUACC21]
MGESDDWAFYYLDLPHLCDRHLTDAQLLFILENISYFYTFKNREYAKIML